MISSSATKQLRTERATDWYMRGEQPSGVSLLRNIRAETSSVVDPDPVGSGIFFPRSGIFFRIRIQAKMKKIIKILLVYQNRYTINTTGTGSVADQD